MGLLLGIAANKSVDTFHYHTISTAAAAAAVFN